MIIFPEDSANLGLRPQDWQLGVIVKIIQFLHVL
jgi:hypothetical protein